MFWHDDFYGCPERVGGRHDIQQARRQFGMGQADVFFTDLDRTLDGGGGSVFLRKTAVLYDELYLLICRKAYL